MILNNNEDFLPSAIEIARQQSRKKAVRKSFILSTLSTVIVFVLVIYAMVNSSGWERFQDSFFDSEVFWFSWPKILQALLVNLQVLFFATIGVAILGALLAIMRTLKGPVLLPFRIISAVYTDIFRGLPLILVLYLIGFGLPSLEIFPKMPAAFWGCIALIVSYSAYVSEVLRSGISSVHPSQIMAANALGLSRRVTMQKIIFPQAIKNVTPALINDAVTIQKDVGLISILGVVEAVSTAKIIQAQYYNFTSYIVAGLVFIALSIPLIRFIDWLSARQVKKQQQGQVA